MLKFLVSPRNLISAPKLFIIQILKMSRDIIKEIPELDNPKVHIANKDNVNRLINELINGGYQKLQVVSDFDKTITKQHENGKPHLSSFGIFARCKKLPPSYLETEQNLAKKYIPIENDPNIPMDEKKVLLEEWWNLSEKNVLGLKVTEADIDAVVAEVGPSLRDGCVDLFKDLSNLDVPVLVFSAGLGDTVVSALKHYDVLLPNVKVVSNFMKWNSDGIVEGYKGRIINSFNKNEMALEGTEYFDLVKNRHNIIVMGDCLGDAKMADGVPETNAVLKIGFLYEHAQGNLPNYMEHFDIVLEDDQTMNLLNAILKLIKSESS